MSLLQWHAYAPASRLASIILYSYFLYFWRQKRRFYFNKYWLFIFLTNRIKVILFVKSASRYIPHTAELIQSRQRKTTLNTQFSIFRQILKKLRVEWRCLTPRFASTPERRNENINLTTFKLFKYKFVNVKKTVRGLPVKFERQY